MLGRNPFFGSTPRPECLWPGPVGDEGTLPPVPEVSLHDGFILDETETVPS